MIKALLKFIRLPNLIIVGLTQYLLLYGLLMPYLEQEGIGRTLDHLHFFLFVLDTVIITLSGNIINDIEDHQIDLINRPESVFVSKHISIKNAWWLYEVVVLIGFLLALYLAFHIDKLPLVLIYPAAVAMLYFYSTTFKKQALIGNLVVSIFCGGVAAIILFAERDAYHQLSETVQHAAWWAFAAYSIFAFFTTLFREIIKDIEDMEGDAQRNCKTLPIVIGEQKARIVAFISGMVLFPLLIWVAYFFYASQYNIVLWLYPILLIMFPMAYLIYLLWKAQAKDDYHRISSYMKGIMLTGLLYLPLFYFWG